MDPYFLGLWLGDGSKDDPSICCASSVADQLTSRLRDGLRWYEDLVVTVREDLTIMRPRRRSRICRQGHDWTADEMGNGTLRSGAPSVTCGACQRSGALGEVLLTMRERLRQIGVLGAKHIPTAYLAASRQQRTALLQGSWTVMEQ